MKPLIHLDTNVFVYAEGRDHPLREPSRRVLALTSSSAFFTDAEVFQELLHRYMLLGTWGDMHPWFSSLIDLMTGRTVPMILDDVERASGMAAVYGSLSARDLIHVAVMHRVGSKHIVTADRDFDRIEGITRLDPGQVDEWQSLVSGN